MHVVPPSLDKRDRARSLDDRVALGAVARLAREFENRFPAHAPLLGLGNESCKVGRQDLDALADARPDDRTVCAPSNLVL
jgi:hypothetical protein